MSHIHVIHQCCMQCIYHSHLWITMRQYYLFWFLCVWSYNIQLPLTVAVKCCYFDSLLLLFPLVLTGKPELRHPWYISGPYHLSMVCQYMNMNHLLWWQSVSTCTCLSAWTWFVCILVQLVNSDCQHAARKGNALSPFCIALCVARVPVVKRLLKCLIRLSLSIYVISLFPHWPLSLFCVFDLWFVIHLNAIGQRWLGSSC